MKKLFDWFKSVFTKTTDSARANSGRLRSLKNRLADPFRASNNSSTEIKPVWVFGPLTWQFFRIGASLIAAVLIVAFGWAALELLLWLTGATLKFKSTFWVGTTVAIALIIALAELPNDSITVPETKFYALLTWLGKPIPVVLETGRYGWLGKIIGFGVSTKVDENFTDEQGFINAGTIPFEIWNQATEKAHKNVVISAPAKNRSDVRATFILVLEPFNPIPMLNSSDPARDIADRARQEYRELVTNFVDTDLPHLQETIGEVLIGDAKLVTTFLTKQQRGYKAGAMVTNRSNRAMFKLVKEGESIEDAKRIFRDDVLANIHPDLRALVVSDDEMINIEVISVKNPITEVTGALGFKITRVALGDIILPDEVTRAANQASAEVDERNAQLASARTMKAVRKELLPSAEELQNPACENAMMLAAAQDDKTGSIKVIHTTGGNPLASALVAGAESMKGERKDDVDNS